VLAVLPSCWSTAPSQADGGAEGGTVPESGPSPDAGPVDATSPEADVIDVTDASDAPDAAGPCSTSACLDDGGPMLVLPFVYYPELAMVGGSLLVSDSRYSDPTCGQDYVIVAQPSAGVFVAFSGSCTHACCNVYFNGDGFSCPCHGSMFDLNGQVTNGPATLALQELPTCSDGCGVFVQLV
jgi:nitrite reductase/ring-hydroxylating ferredoxin subunit